MLRFLAFGFAAIIAFCPAIVHAQDEGLYDAPLPEDAAFVRFIGYDAAAPMEVFGITFDAERLTSRQYNVLQAGTLEGLEAGEILTLVPSPEGDVAVLSEPARPDRKVALRLINLSANPGMTLKTADGAVEIIADVKNHSIGFREVNPIQVEVAVFSGTDRISEVFPLTLRLNQHLTFVVFDDGEVALLEDAINPEPLR